MSDNVTTILSATTDDINIPLYLSFTVFLFVIGIVGNSLIILSILLNRNLQVVGCTFTFNLAVSDLGVLVLSDLFIIIGIATDGRVFLENPTFCRVTSYSCLALCVVSIWNVAAGSFHSYVRICHRLKYHRIFRRYSWLAAIILAWMIGIMLLLPSLVGWGSHSYDEVLRYCTFDYKQSASFTRILIVFGVGLPLSLASYSFMSIACHVFSSRRRLKRIGSGIVSNPRSNRRLGLPARINATDSRLFRSFLLVVMYLGSTWMFLIVIWICGDTRNWSSYQIAFAMTAAHSHCSMNGVLYAITNAHFRKAFVKILRCGLRSNRNRLAIVIELKRPNESAMQVHIRR